MKKLLIISMIFILTACSAGGSELARNQQTWEDANISHYQFELNLSCFCAFRDQMPLTVEVQDGEVVSMTAVDGNPVSTDDPLSEYFDHFATVDRLFAELEKAMAGSEAGDIIISYDAALGFPTEASIDYIKGAADDELYVSVSGFERLP